MGGMAISDGIKKIFGQRHTSFTSQFAIGDTVNALGNVGVIKAVKFTESKVTYDVDLAIGGETMRNIDSTFVDNLLERQAA